MDNEKEENGLSPIVLDVMTEVQTPIPPLYHNILKNSLCVNFQWFIISTIFFIFTMEKYLQICTVLNLD
jgi:hypothetical protein